MMMSTIRNGRVRGRLAPSPTGYIHLGNAWAFMLAWLAARRDSGQIVLRMEDIDPDRARPEYAAAIQRDLEWLGIDWDEGPDVGGIHAPYTQSQRLALYAEGLQLLSDAGHTYPCFCTRKELRALAGAPHRDDPGEGIVYPGTCRTLSLAEQEAHVRAGRRASIRVRCSGEDVSFRDLRFGLQHVSLVDCGGDFPVRRSDGVFAYQLAVVLDDIAMGITQVVRGDDLLHCTPRQVLLYRLFGAEAPVYLHVPLLLDAEGERLAKRHQSLEIRQLRDAGVPASHIIGYLAWLAGITDSPAPAMPQELVTAFDVHRLPSRAVRIASSPVAWLCGL